MIYVVDEGDRYYNNGWIVSYGRGRLYRMSKGDMRKDMD